VRLGVEVPREAYTEEIRRQAGRAWDDLVRRQLLHPAARRPTGELPATFAEMLAAAEALGGEAAVTTRRHYLEVMPRLLVDQVARHAEPNASLFHTPLAGSRLPRLRRAIERLAAMLAEAGVDEAQTPLGVEAWQRLRAEGTVSVFELYEPTHYAGFMPLLYGTAADLARAARSRDRLGSIEAVVDAHLTTPLVHELTHMGRQRESILPLHLDECLAGYFGVMAHRAFAYPEEGEEDALYAAPWFAQIGQALVRVTGVSAALRAHAGVARWEDVLPPGLAEAAHRLGWREYEERRFLHFLSDVQRPDRWQKLFFLCAAGQADRVPDAIEGLDAIAWRDIPAPPDDPLDEQIAIDGRAALALRHELDGGAHVVRPAPEVGEITLDLEQMCVRCGDERYLYPLTWAAREWG
jgi:hypothetical protein